MSDEVRSVAVRVDAVLTVLSDGRAVHAVMAEEGGPEAMSPESVWIQASTVGAGVDRGADRARGAGRGAVRRLAGARDQGAR